MVRKKMFLLFVLCLIAFAQSSCIHGDLDDCPPMVQYAVAFEYTHHMYSGDRFYDDVKKINLYVFDDDNLVYTTTTELSPFESNFTVPLDLPMGKYNIITWGNVLDNSPVSITPANFQKGVTTLQEARLTLQRDINNNSSHELEKIFFGDTIVEIPLYVSRVDTVPLINDTHNIRVVLHWDHTDAVPLSYGQYIDYHEIDVTLHGHNAVYFFNDMPAPNDVNYHPYAIDRTGEILRTNIWEHTLRINYYPDDLEAEMDSTVFDFKVLRLVPGNELRMTVLQNSTVSGPENLLGILGSPQRKDPSYGIDIVGSFTDGNGFSKYKRENLNVPDPIMLQSSFDRYENYRVDVYLKYHPVANTYYSLMEVKIQDWHSRQDSVVLK